MRLRAATVLAAVAALVAIAAPPALASRAAGPARAQAQLSAQIRYTTGGVPHILAHSWPGLGFGYGYAFAQDNLCTMANDYVTVEAQRSRYFGPTGVDIERGNGVVVSNLDSDLFYQQIIDSGVVQHLAQALSPTEKQVEAGYVKGYNAYLAHVGGAAGVPDPTCRGQAWVKPITLLDSYLRFYQLMLLSSSGAVIQGISEAAPPKAGAAAAQASAAATARTGRALAAALRAQRRSMGSNAVAIGSAGTRDHRGLLLGNPHFPWLGTERFFQSQLTIPGKINVTGASLYGVPLILIGHNASVAWSHTVSTAFRFTPFQLTLVPGHPTRVPAERQGRGDDPAARSRSWPSSRTAAWPRSPHVLVDPLRPDVQQPRGHLAALGHHRRRSPSPTSTPATSPGPSTPGSASTGRPPPSRCCRSCRSTRASPG